MQVALCLVITESLEDVANGGVPKLVTAEDLEKVDYKITGADVDEAARQAKVALGIH